MKLRYTRRALADYNRILTYIGRHSPQGAAKVQARIEELLNLALEHPFAGVRTRNKRIRKLIAHPYPYLVFYEARADSVTVIHMCHAARRPSSMPG